MKRNIIITIISVCFIVGMAIIVWHISQPQNVYLSYEKYTKLKTGMSYKQCTEVIGKKGTLTTTSKSDDDVVKVYSYEDRASNMNLVFFNDILLHKGQSGLKKAEPKSKNISCYYKTYIADSMNYQYRTKIHTLKDEKGDCNILFWIYILKGIFKK